MPAPLSHAGADLEVEYLAGRLDRPAVAEKLAAQASQHARLRREVDGLGLWVALPHGTRDGPPLPYADVLLRTRPIPETEALGPAGLRELGLGAGTDAQQLRALRALQDANAHAMERVLARTETVLRAPTPLVAPPPPAPSDPVATARLLNVLRTGGGVGGGR